MSRNAGAAAASPSGVSSRTELYAYQVRREGASSLASARWARGWFGARGDRGSPVNRPVGEDSIARPFEFPMRTTRAASSTKRCSRSST